MKKMSLEEYKKKVEKSLMMNNNCSGEVAKQLMKIHEKDFPQLLKDGWTPEEASLGMAMNYI